jgi:transmembrane E3 ubiquitin-protein ligase
MFQTAWVYGVVIFVVLQVTVIMLQEYFGPTLILPRGVCSCLCLVRHSRLTDIVFLQVATIDVYNYHPPLPLPDPEAPEQSLGDCSICMDSIEVDPALRARTDEKSEGLSRHTTNLWAQSARKSYSLAPCHHLFVCCNLSLE